MLTDRNYTLAVIVPFWNCEADIGAFLDCLLMQTFTDWIAFFVDDNCTDGSASIVREYARRDQRIHYFLRERSPKGSTTCRNIGFELSQGAEYLVSLDADDLISSDCFDQRVRFMNANPTIDFASFPTKAFWTDKYDATFWGFGVPGRQDLLLSLLYWKTLQIFGNSNIYRRKRLVETGIRWDERLLSMTDADFNIQSLTRGLKHSFDVDARIDYFYRQRQGTISRRISDPSMFESHLYYIRKEVDSIRSAFNTRYDFYLRAFIVNLFALFGKNRSPYLSLLKLGFVKQSPVFFFQIVLYLLLGMRGKSKVFRKYTAYSNESAQEWKSIVTNSFHKKVLEDSLHG